MFDFERILRNAFKITEENAVKSCLDDFQNLKLKRILVFLYMSIAAMTVLNIVGDDDNIVSCSWNSMDNEEWGMNRMQMMNYHLLMKGLTSTSKFEFELYFNRTASTISRIPQNREEWEANANSGHTVRLLDLAFAAGVLLLVTIWVHAIWNDFRTLYYTGLEKLMFSCASERDDTNLQDAMVKILWHLRYYGQLRQRYLLCAGYFLTKVLALASYVLHLYGLFHFVDPILRSEHPEWSFYNLGFLMPSMIWSSCQQGACPVVNSKFLAGIYNLPMPLMPRNHHVAVCVFPHYNILHILIPIMWLLVFFFCLISLCSTVAICRSLLHQRRQTQHILQNSDFSDYEKQIMMSPNFDLIMHHICSCKTI